jgi:hypothetical protein
MGDHDSGLWSLGAEIVVSHFGVAGNGPAQVHCSVIRKLDHSEIVVCSERGSSLGSAMNERDVRSSRPSGLPKVEYLELKRRRIPEAKTLAPMIEKLLREFAPTVARDRGARLDEIEEIWRRAVGDEISAHTRPGRFRGGVLTILVESAPLAAELESFAREHLHEALEREGLEGLCELKFKCGG